jgi:hypothetical protein
MAMRPSKKRKKNAFVSLLNRSPDSKKRRTEAVVAAADGLARAKAAHQVYNPHRRRASTKDIPRVSGDANNADGAAGEPNNDVEVLEDDAQQPKEEAGGGVRRLSGGVAALNGAGAARGGGLGGSRSATSGDSNGSSGKSQSGQKLELHIGDWKDGLLELVVSEVWGWFLTSFIQILDGVVLL